MRWILPGVLALFAGLPALPAMAFDRTVDIDMSCSDSTGRTLDFEITNKGEIFVFEGLNPKAPVDLFDADVSLRFTWKGNHYWMPDKGAEPFLWRITRADGSIEQLEGSCVYP